MSRRLCVGSLVASIVIGALGAYLISFYPLRPKLYRAAVPERGDPGVPSDPMELVGRYVESDGTSARSLTLLSNGTYFGAWDTDIGPAGKVAGSWRLNATQLILSASSATNSGMMNGYLRVLDVYRFKTNWLFVRTKTVVVDTTWPNHRAALGAGGAFRLHSWLCFPGPSEHGRWT